MYCKLWWKLRFKGTPERSHYSDQSPTPPHPTLCARPSEKAAKLSPQMKNRNRWDFCMSLDVSLWLPTKTPIETQSGTASFLNKMWPLFFFFLISWCAAWSRSLTHIRKKQWTHTCQLYPNPLPHSDFSKAFPQCTAPAFARWVTIDQGWGDASHMLTSGDLDKKTLNSWRHGYGLVGSIHALARWISWIWLRSLPHHSFLTSGYLTMAEMLYFLISIQRAGLKPSIL